MRHVRASRRPGLVPAALPLAGAALPAVVLTAALTTSLVDGQGRPPSFWAVLLLGWIGVAGVLLRRPRTTLRVLSSSLLVAAGALVVGLAVGPLFDIYRPVLVLSDSMRPAYRAGDLIVDTPERPQALRVGQVISFRDPLGGALVSHRIVKILKPGERPVILTKGDANAERDPWRARLDGSTVWRYRLTIPWVGYPLLYLRDPTWRLPILYAASALLALAGLARLGRDHVPPWRHGRAGA